MALSPKGACVIAHNKITDKFRIYYLRRIKFVTKKVNFVNISYLLFPISFRPPRHLSPWRPSPPFRGRAMCYEASLGDSRGRALLRYAGSRPPRQHSLALSPFQGACDGLREFIQGFEGRTPLAILRMALSPKGACDVLRDFARRFRGVRSIPQDFPKEDFA